MAYEVNSGFIYSLENKETLIKSKTVSLQDRRDFCLELGTAGLDGLEGEYYHGGHLVKVTWYSGHLS